MSITIRAATLADLDRIAPLFDAYRGFYGQATDLVRARHWLQQRLSAQEAFVLLAEVDGAPAGFVLLYPGWSSVAAGATLLLNDLFVAPEARRLGIGSRLLRAAADLGKQRGALRLVLETASDNHAAQALYRREGWTAESSQWFHLPLGPA
jgi:ribosomal protein S18 acetylase RimI-like enzyme